MPKPKETTMTYSQLVSEGKRYCERIREKLDAGEPDAALYYKSGLHAYYMLALSIFHKFSDEYERDIGYREG